MPRLWSLRSASVTSLASTGPSSARQRLKQWRSRASLRSSYLESLQAEEHSEVFMFVESGQMSDDEEGFCVVEHDRGEQTIPRMVDVDTWSTFSSGHNAGRHSPAIVVSTPQRHPSSPPFSTSFAPPFTSKAAARPANSTATLPACRLDPSRLMPLSHRNADAFGSLGLNFDAALFTYGESEDDKLPPPDPQGDVGAAWKHESPLGSAMIQTSGTPCASQSSSLHDSSTSMDSVQARQKKMSKISDYDGTVGPADLADDFLDDVNVAFGYLEHS